MAIIWNTRDNSGGFGGYTNGAWSSFMNTYAVRFTSATTGTGSAYNGSTFNRSYSVYFPNSGNYTITAAADDSGTLNVGGVNCSVAGFSGSSSTTRFYNRGTYTVSLSVYNQPNGNVFTSNPYGIAITIDAPPPPPAPSISFSVSPTSFCSGSSATLSWSVSGIVSSVSIDQGIGSVGTSGSRTVSPSSSTTYTLTASGEGGSSSATATLIVKQPSNTNLTTDSSSIIRGQSTTLRWVTGGDSTAASISPGIGSVNINGLTTISPTETTTYEIYVDGVCNDAYDSVTLVVYQPPTVDLSGPETLDYNQQGTLTYESTYADIKLEIIPSYTYKTGTVLGDVISLPVGNPSNGTLETQIPYNDNGPFSVSYIIVGMGNGGQESKQITIPINVDETPENFLVPESEDLFKDQQPIYTPNVSLTSYEIVIDDIDVPVEIKADKPILIEVNNDDSWKQIREL